MKLLIIGAGGHGFAVAETAQQMNSFTYIAFLDDAVTESRNQAEWPIIGTTADIHERAKQFDIAIAAIGSNGKRAEWANLIDRAGLPQATIIHPTAYISPRASIGRGTTIMATSVVGPYAILGEGNILNCRAVVDHDASLGDFVHLGIGVNLCGGTKVGARSHIHAGCVADYGVEIPDDSVIPTGTILSQREAPKNV